MHRARWASWKLRAREKVRLKRMPHATNVDNWACQNRMCARACGLMRGRRRCEGEQFVKKTAHEKSDRNSIKTRKRDGRRTGARHMSIWVARLVSVVTACLAHIYTRHTAAPARRKLRCRSSSSVTICASREELMKNEQRLCRPCRVSCSRVRLSVFSSSESCHPS